MIIPVEFVYYFKVILSMKTFLIKFFPFVTIITVDWMAKSYG